MNGRPEINHDVILGHLDGGQIRKAAVHVADRIAAQHPQLTAAEIAANPGILAGFLELLDQLGLRNHTSRGTR